MHLFLIRKTTYELLCQILSPQVTNAEEICRNDVPVWPLLYELADANFVLPELRRAIHAKKLWDYVPKDMLNALDTVGRLVDTRCNDLLEQIIEVSSVLNEVGIRPVWLKGAALLTETEGRQRPRIMSDLDVWIPSQKQQTEALMVLARIGYSPKPNALSVNWSGSHHYAPLHHPQRPVSLEVHRHVVRPAFRTLLADSDAENRLDLTTLDGLSIARLAMRDRIMHSLIQCTLMSTPPIETGQIRLMKVMDLLGLLGRENSHEIPEEVVDIIAASQWHRPLRRFLTLLERDFNVRNPLGTDDAYCKAVDHLLLTGRLSPRAVLRQILRPPGNWRSFFAEPWTWRSKIRNRLRPGGAPVLSRPD